MEKLGPEFRILSYREDLTICVQWLRPFAVDQARCRPETALAPALAPSHTLGTWLILFLSAQRLALGYCGDTGIYPADTLLFFCPPLILAQDLKVNVKFPYAYSIHPHNMLWGRHHYFLSPLPLMPPMSLCYVSRSNGRGELQVNSFTGGGIQQNLGWVAFCVVWEKEKEKILEG